MRLLRLRLRNFRGVAEREVVFARDGVTVVEGPNEVGKSSLAEALDLLFFQLDDSRKREVLAVKPVHLDAGSEVELEAETGPYAFVYTKRFHRDRKTELRVSRPRVESRTGREAHERALEILRETIDVDLWKALRIQQGDGVALPELAGQRSLAAALDRAAGGSPAGAAEESLFERAARAYEEWFTPSTGKEKAPLVEARRTLASAREAAEAARAALERVEADVAQASALEQRERVLGPRLAELEARAAALAADRAAVERLRGDCDALEARASAARAEARAAGDEAARRQRLVSDVESARVERDALGADDAAATGAWDAAQAALAAAEQAARGAARAATEAEELSLLRRRDEAFRRGELDVAQLRERRDRIVEARRDEALARDVLAKTRVHDRDVEGLKAAQLALASARARFETDAPSLALRALAPMTPEIDGDAVELGAGEERTWLVAETTRVVLPGILEMRFAPSADAAKRADELARADETFRRACAACGVDGVAEAEAALARRREAEAQLVRIERVLRENRRDLTDDVIAQKIEDLAARLAAYPQERAAKRPSGPEIPSDLDAAKAANAAAEAALATAREALARAERARDAAREEHDRLKAARIERLTRLDIATRRLADTTAALERERGVCADDALVAQLAERSAFADGLETERARAAQRLADLDPESVTARAENAGAALAQARAEERELRDRLIDLRARLATRGEEGLHDRRDEAAGRLARAQADLAARTRRAEAARALFDALRTERERARKAYAQPLRERIESLGRIVFGPSFRVELDDELRVVQRALGDVAVPFESLSGGAQEQISLLARLAAAQCVATEGGAPLLLDDALGYSDPARLEEMGAVLRLVGRSCQVVIFTCVPDRYRAVGDAHVVRLT